MEIPVRIGNVYGSQFGTGYAGNVWDKESVSPTIMTAQGGGRVPMILEVYERDLRIEQKPR